MTMMIPPSEETPGAGLAEQELIVPELAEQDSALTAVEAEELGLAPAVKPRSMLRRGWEVFRENKLALASLGLAFYNAALNVDYQVLLGFTVLATVATIFGNLLADISYAVLDPRVRYS